MLHKVVTGANKGIGLEIVRQLASKGIKVVLTARDEKKGLQALQNLKANNNDFSELVVFHQLDVADAASVASLANFVKSQFGKLDILAVSEADRKKAIVETDEITEECLQINYYGAKRTTKSLLPLLQLSDSPRIVNVSSSMGKLESLSNEWAKGVFSDAENLTEEKIDDVLNEFVKDFKEGSIESKGWPKNLGPYTVSKAALNAYTRILAKKNPTFCVSCVCPGFVRTDINGNNGILTVEEGAASPVRVALLPDGSPSSLFYIRSEVSSF